MSKIPIFDPSQEIERLKNPIEKAISKILSHGQFILGPEVKKFEENVASYLGVRHAVGVNSGTDALVIAMRALGIGKGDEVITSSMSFFATAESISMVGAKPVFVDVDERSFNIDTDKIEEKITENTKAIIPIHLFGLPAHLSKINGIAEKYNLKVIEDCAQSFGAKYYANCLACEGENCDKKISSSLKDKYTGAIGDAGAFSFFPTKNLGGIGDGGLITTNSDLVAEKARMLRVHGSSLHDKYQNLMLGYNSRLDTIQAAVLDIKLSEIDESNKKRISVAKNYSNFLEEVESMICPEIIRGHVFHQYTIRVKNGKRNQLKKYLKEHGIGSNIYFPIPQNELPVYSDENYPILPKARTMADEVLSLPMWPDIEEDKQRVVANTIKEFFAQK